jgi:hypothetical protein
MKAEPILIERRRYDAESFAEIAIWHLPEPLPGGTHSFKYRLAFVTNGRCVLRYDNERGKGDHLHRDGEEAPYRFRGLPLLLADFGRELQRWRQTHGHLDDRSGHP